MLRQDTRLHFSSDLINLFLFSNSLPDWTPKQFFSVHLVREKALKNVTCSYAFAQQTNFVIFSRQVNWSNGFHRYFLTVRDRSSAGLLISLLLLKVYLIMFFYLIFARVECISSICIPSILFLPVTVTVAPCQGLVSYTSVFLSYLHRHLSSKSPVSACFHITSSVLALCLYPHPCSHFPHPAVHCLPLICLCSLHSFIFADSSIGVWKSY